MKTPPPASKRPARRNHAIRQIALFAFPGAQSLDIVGPLEVFSAANNIVEKHYPALKGIRVSILGLSPSSPGPTTCASPPASP